MSNSMARLLVRQEMMWNVLRSDVKLDWELNRSEDGFAALCDVCSESRQQPQLKGSCSGNRSEKVVRRNLQLPYCLLLRHKMTIAFLFGERR